VALEREPIILAAAARLSRDILSGNNQGSLAFMLAEASEIPRFFQPGEISRLYINFCDPWPNKNKWAKRRLTHVSFLDMYQALEIPEIHFKTDNRYLFEFSINQFSERGWKMRNVSLDLHKSNSNMSGNIMTEYEEKFSPYGPIYRLEAYKDHSLERASQVHSRMVEILQEDTTAAMANYFADPTMANMLRMEFAKEQKEFLPQLDAALACKDYKTAHRLVHTIKGLAGLVGEAPLVKAAFDAERVLKAHSDPGQFLDTLRQEFNLVVSRIQITDAPADIAAPANAMDLREAEFLLETLREFLVSGNAKSLDLVEEIRRLPDAERLAVLVEDCDFPSALEELRRMQATLEVNDGC